MTPDFPNFKAWIKDHSYTPTELEDYLACPFRFYAGSFLKLKPLPETDVEMTPSELGQSLHRILEKFLEGGRGGPGNEERLLAIAEETLEGFRKTRTGLSSALFEKKKETIQKTLSAFFEKEETRLGSGKLGPKHLEWSFGAGKVPPLEIQAGTGQTGKTGRILIKGRIDRIDVDPEKKRFLVIDYKTGSSRQTGASIERGESLQLPLYILAVQKILLPGFEPIGGLYYQLSDLTLKEGILHTDRIPEGLEIHPRSSSLIPPTRWDSLLEKAEGRVREIVEKIEAEQFAPTPDRCDSYCPYKEICLLS